MSKVTPHELKAPYEIFDLSKCEWESPPTDWSEKHKTSKLVLRRIEKGTFERRNPPQENIISQVTIPGDFYIGVFPVTQEQYEQVMLEQWQRDRGATVDRSAIKGPAKPTLNVKYDNAIQFVEKLSQKVAEPNLSFNLPTEAQWIYAACWLETDTPTLGNRVNVADVGCDDPNANGLYDMHGPVREWCLEKKQICGNGINNPSCTATCADSYYDGFRVCLTLTAQQTPPTEEAGE